jgi:hypothetical protein
VNEFVSEQLMCMDEPVLPYNGTSGWSGSDTSRERAERNDADGTTGKNQKRTLQWLARCGREGVTWQELADVYEWHHGVASGVLSVLHKSGDIARLSERRNRCAVYVLPQFVDGRDVASHGRNSNEVQWRKHIAGEVMAYHDAEHLFNYFTPCDCSAIADRIKAGAS